MKAPSNSNAAANERSFDEALPWYVNGTLAADEKAWIEARVAASPDLAGKLQDELMLATAVRSTLAQAPGATSADDDDEDLALLMARVRAEPETCVAIAPLPMSSLGSGRRWRSAFPTWVSRPSMMGMALASLVILQTGLMAWMAARPPEIVGAVHSEIVTEMRTLRVTFKPEASEARIRTLLVGASVRIVGGPTQLGEYWVASTTRSLEEMQASLRQSGLVDSMEVDTVGPHGQ